VFTVKTLLFILSFSMLFAVNVHADSFYLKDGKIVRGTIIKEDNKMYLLDMGNTWEEVDKNTVKFIKKDDQQHVKPSVVTPTTHKEEKSAPAVPVNNLTEIGKWETILKIAADVEGKHKFSNVQVTGTGMVDQESSKIGTGKTLTVEEVYYLGPRTGIGAGISYQMTHQEPTTQGHFSFIPIYGLLRMRLTPINDNQYAFATAQLGYNYFTADQKYAGAGKYVMTNGVYAGLGAGYVFGRMQVEALYTLDRGKIKSDGYDVNNDPYSISADSSYSKISLSIGVLF
jgi:hypothetical protein